MNSTGNYHVKANPTLICYNEIHFVSTHLYLLWTGTLLARSWRGGRTAAMQGAEPCQHSSSASSRQQEPLAQHSTAGGRLPAARGHPRVSRGSSSGMLGGPSPDEPRPAAADPPQECSAGPAPCPLTCGCEGVELCEVATLCSAVAAARGIERLSGDSVAKSCLQ